MHSIRIIALLFATGIILLHSFIPHRHIEEMTDVEHLSKHERANDLIDLLGLAFHEGTGDVLAQYIRSEQRISKKINVGWLGVLVNALHHVELPSSFVCGSFRLPSQIIFEQKKILPNGLRAPPGHDHYA